MNDYTCTANLVKDPELRMTQSGKTVANMRLAINTRRKKIDGDGFVTLYMNAVCWGNFANVINQSLHKGDQVTIQGELVPREYTTREGQKRIEIELNCNEVVLPKRSQSRPNVDDEYNYSSSTNQYNPHYLDGAEEVTDETDLPF